MSDLAEIFKIENEARRLGYSSGLADGKKAGLRRAAEKARADAESDFIPTEGAVRLEIFTDEIEREAEQ